MLDSAANLGFPAVVLFLRIGQWLIAIPFFTNLVFDMLRQLLANIGTICIRSFILFGEEIFKFLFLLYPFFA